MPVFTDEEFEHPKSMEHALEQLLCGRKSSDGDANLFPLGWSLSWRIIQLERLHQAARKNSGAGKILYDFHDYCEWVGERRPNPLFDEWIWLYRNIGYRHPKFALEYVCGLMAGRDALLPFLKTVPDKRFRAEIAEFDNTSPKGKNPISAYPMIEDAIQNDSPAKLKILSLMSKNINLKTIMERGVFLQKTELVCSMLPQLTIKQIMPLLIQAICTWKNPLPFLQHILELLLDEIRSWRDRSGNNLFWYLYYREPVQRELVETVDSAIPELFEAKNCYGISPSDIWVYYRPRAVFEKRETSG